MAKLNKDWRAQNRMPPNVCRPMPAKMAAAIEAGGANNARPSRPRPG
jgi:hypothetical protein